MMFSKLISWMFPSFCHQCGREAGFLCFRCFHSVTFAPHLRHVSDLEVLSCLYYQPDSLLAELVHFYKFEHGQALRSLFVSWMAEVLRLFYGSTEGFALIPAPSSPMHFHERGFDPATELANCLGELLGIPVVPLLKHRDDEGSQSHLGREERAMHAQNLFVFQGAPPKGYTFLLVDDIVTTGSTLLSARKTLAEAGVRVARAITLADRELLYDHRH